jgi:7,8-dihydroneopterin aldolase/epimerase/oxygenase
VLIYIDNLVTLLPVGVLPHEQKSKQRVRFNLEVLCNDPGLCEDELSRTFNYATLLHEVETMAEGQQIALLETLCERLAAVALKHGAVKQIKVRVDKLDLLPDGATVGLCRTFCKEHI